MRGAGKVSLDHAAMAAVYFFEDLAVPLQEYGIRVQQPTVQEVKQILRVRTRAAAGGGVVFCAWVMETCAHAHA